MKMLECKRNNVHDIGFIDPYIVNEHTLHKHLKDMEHDLYTFLVENNFCK